MTLVLVVACDLNGFQHTGREYGWNRPFEIDGVTNIDGTAQIEIAELPTCPLLTVQRYCVRIGDHYPGDGW